MAMAESGISLKVGVVGAGIAGLSAAAGLRRAGHQVELFETSNFKSEVGAAITVTPNGAKVLRHWGVDPGIDAVKSEGIRLVHHQSLTPFFSSDFDDFQKEFGDELWHYHRVDLHHIVRELATADNHGPPATVKLGEAVADIDPEAGVITLESGQQIRKDLIIVANGVKSKFVPRIVDNPPPLRKNGQSAFRALVPFASINQNPSLAKVFTSNPHGFWVPYQLEGGRRYSVVTYPCRAFELLNIAIIHTTLPQYRNNEDWHDPASIEDILEALQDFNPLVKDLLKLAPEIKAYNLFYRDPLPTFHKGRAIIIGDAAAVIQPQHAQGGTAALEEGAALEILFSNMSSRDQVSERALWYDELVGKRVKIVQLLSDVHPYANDGMRERLEDFMGDEKDTLPVKDSQPFSKPIRDYIWPYNVLDEATRFVADKGVQATA